MCSCAVWATVLLPGTASAEYASTPATAVVQQTPDNDGGPRDDGRDSDGDNGLWGLLGLLGLVGLGGLARRGPKSGAMTGYPGAGTEAPPVNTYPPAEPRRRPPGE
ncbi:WGxxGxxG family protein [Amycolatopsis azurea]|uniref:WGxxGxxG family protein n=1 Tax=Amycolatopsis azurea TaxID=36819 RepID=UPI0037F2CEDA